MAATASDGPENFDIAIVRISTGDGSGADITFEFNGKNICLSLFASSSGGPASSWGETAIEDHLICLLDRAVNAPDDEYEQAMDEVLDIILDAGKPSFVEATTAGQAAAPPSPMLTDLHSCLYPETFNFRLQTVESKPKVYAIRPDEGNSLPDTGPDPDFPSDYSQIDDQLPRYSSKKLEISEFLLKGSAVVGRVRIDGREMLCKAHRSGLQNASFEQELTSLDRIRRASYLDATGQGVEEDTTAIAGIRVPMLLGYVTHAESGAVIGLLREWIPSGQLGDTLRDVDVSAVAPEMKEKWMAQIRSTISRLHDLDIIWGDGKASNVVIDASYNAWLIDFGGGWSEGWVDEEYSGTVRGDDQAVENIVKFLSV